MVILCAEPFSTSFDDHYRRFYYACYHFLDARLAVALFDIDQRDSFDFMHSWLKGKRKGFDLTKLSDCRFFCPEFFRRNSTKYLDVFVVALKRGRHSGQSCALTVDELDRYARQQLVRFYQLDVRRSLFLWYRLDPLFRALFQNVLDYRDPRTRQYSFPVELRPTHTVKQAILGDLKHALKRLLQFI